MERIHVLQLIDGLHVGGAEVLLRDLIQGLMQEGRFRVSVGYSTPGALVEQIAALGVPLTRFPRLARIDPQLLLRMQATMRKDMPQVVHTHLFKSDFHGRMAARLSGAPVVVSTLHNNSDWAKNRLLGLVYGGTARLADRLIAVSEEVREFSIAHMGLPSERVVTIRNGVPIARFSNQQAAGHALRAELGIRPDTLLVGIVARLNPQKDHRNFLHAAARIYEEVPSARFLIVGDGELRGELELLAQSLGLSDAVIFAGLRGDVPAVLAAIDILVFSSAWEGLPVALLEAMAARCPVVSTAVGGVPGVLLDGKTGLLVPASNSPALAQAIVTLLRDAVLRERMGQAGFERVEAYYSIGAMVDQTISLYDQLLHKRGLGKIIHHGAHR